MKLSLNWLQDWVDLDGIAVDTLVERLTLAGIEVAGVQVFADDRIVVGRIEAIEPHPKSDKLVVCTVDAGEERRRTIVCGAKNMKAGDVVPVALDGARPVGVDFEIVTRAVAGVTSEGMLCAEEELGLSNHSEGLWILDPSLPIGAPVYTATKTADTRIEVELTPNRSDCLSHKGIARELAALLGRTMRAPSRRIPDAVAAPIGDLVSLNVVDAEGCPRYGLAVVEGLHVAESPAWLRHRLAVAGTRAINNVVDVTNYALLDVGQPLHAFDLDKLDGGIVVRRATAGESMQGIDHKEYKVDERDLVIADGRGPVAIAGVMGGERTEVTHDTTRVLIECAQFHPSLVRKTSKRLGMHTESSHRFERGIDSGEVANNLRYAVGILASAVEGCKIAKGWIDHEAAAVQRPVVALTAARVNQILGTDLAQQRIQGILDSLGFDVDVDGETMSCTVPTWRPDVERPIDLIEEVARVYGYDHLTPTLPKIQMGMIHQTRLEPGHPPTIVPRTQLAAIRRVRTLLLGLGLAEAMNYSFFGDDELAELRLGQDDPRSAARPVANPLAADQRLMRTTLVPGLLKALRLNVARRQKSVAMFEIGRVYLASGERERLTLMVTGSRLGNVAEPRAWDFFDLKGIAETLGTPFSLNATWERPAMSEPYLHPGVQANWIAQGKVIASVGQLHPALTKDLATDTPVFVLDLDLDALLGTVARTTKYSPIPRFPAVERDFAFLVDRSCAFGAVETAIRSASSMLESVQLFDVYAGQQVPEGMKSLAIAVSYRASDRTLTEDEISAVDTAIVRAVETQVGGSLR